MIITIISGSNRIDSQSLKIGKHVFYRLFRLAPKVEVEILDLADLQLPFWDEGFDDKAGVWEEKWTPVSKQLAASDGLIIVTPEWGGMVTPMLKNFFLLCGYDEMGHKPALIISVSSGVGGGAYPVAELRSSSYKNNKICYIPEQIIIREVRSYLNDNDKDNDEYDKKLKGRIDFCLNILIQYTKALKSMRKNEVFNLNYLYEYGM